MLTGLASAASWICDNCNTTNDGNFCTNCGARKPSSGSSGGSGSGSISNVQCEMQSNGMVKVTWNDSGNDGPYKVSYTMDDWEKYYYDDDNISKTTTTLMYLVPGETYTITVSGRNSKASTNYTLPRVTFSRYKNNRKLVLTKKEFNLARDGMNQLFTLRFYFTRLKEEQHYVWTLALKTPLGYSSYTVCNPNFKLYASTDHVKWIYWDWSIDTFMNRVKDDYGTIPTGNYTFECFLDGQFYASVDFFVYGP